MKYEKIKAPAALVTALLTILMFYGLYSVGFNRTVKADKVTVGYICEGDDGTPYSENFLQSIDILKKQYGDNVKIKVKDNVPSEDAQQALDELIEEGCGIVFSNSADYGETVKKTAETHPDIEFCQASCSNANEEPQLKNYHTFMGEIYEGWYISGQIAGLKLTELIADGAITKEQAVVGFVGAFPCDEVISAYTAFLLGVRSEYPDAVMHVNYTGAWSDYNLETEAAESLIGEGCIIIAQNSDTIAPAVVCENTETEHPVYHIGYNKDMLNIAPTTSLIGTRIDWSPYICNAVEAVFEGKRIESMMSGHIHGNDVGAGFADGWVKMLELNRAVAPAGAEDVILSTTDMFKRGTCHVFYGDYVGVSPDDPSDEWDLNLEYYENQYSSCPGFHYVLKDVIIIDE